MSMELRKDGDGKDMQKSSEVPAFYNSAGLESDLNSTGWNSAGLECEDRNGLEYPEKNMWINEQDDLGVEEGGSIGTETKCPPDIAVIYPPAQVLLNSSEEIRGYSQIKPENTKILEGAFYDKSKQTIKAGDASCKAYSEEIDCTDDILMLKEATSINSSDHMPIRHSICEKAIRLESSFDSSEDCNQSRSQSSDDNASVRKGRFLLKPAGNSSTDTVSTIRYRKGRFHITETMDIAAFNKKACRMVVALLNRQNKQIDLLFDMIKNISGEEKLFQKEFTYLSDEVYELIEMLKKQTTL